MYLALRAIRIPLLVICVTCTSREKKTPLRYQPERGFDYLAMTRGLLYELLMQCQFIKQLILDGRTIQIGHAVIRK